MTKNTRIASLVFSTAALIAVISATPVTPAAAQGVPAGLLRLDSSQPSEYGFEPSVAQQEKVRSAYAHVRKHEKPVR